MNSVQTQLRTVTANFISDILSLPRWKSDRERMIVYANLTARLTETEKEGTEIVTRTTALTAKALGVEASTELCEACFRCGKMVHALLDDDDEYVFGDDGGLSSKWLQDTTQIAVALLATAPPPFLPTPEPMLIGDGHKLQNDVNLVKNGTKQTRETMPLAMKALDVLFKQAYSLNKDIMNLKNVPIAIDPAKNMAAKIIVLNNTPEFQGVFHFQYTLDNRGRVNARSRIVTPQGSSFDKAVLNFAEAKPLGEYGLQALMIHYANVSGHDKVSFMDRIQWARTTGLLKASKMNDCKGDWLDIKELIEDQKHAFEEYSAAMDFFRATSMLSPKLYPSALVTHQDATNSGFQFGAALTGDRVTAEEVNLTSTQTKYSDPADLYKKMAFNLSDILQGTGLLKRLPAITRYFVKTAVMVTGYGAGIKAVMVDTQKENPTMDDETRDELSEYMKEALQRTASSMLELTAVIRDGVQELDSPEIIEWPTPDGFHCKQVYRSNEHRQVKLNKYLVSYTNKPEGELDPMDDKKMATALPPNFIHSIDSQMLRTAALGADTLGMAFSPIHDSFGTHAATFFDLNRVLKESFVETMSYDWYGILVATNGMKKINIRTGNYRAIECLKATYMFS